MDFAGIWQPYRRPIFLYAADFCLILSELEAEQQVHKSQGRFFGNRDPFDLHKLHSDLRNELTFITYSVSR